MTPPIDMLKRQMGWLASSVAPQCRYTNSIFVIGHMRCGSTALSNILCSRGDVSGYGEAHVAYQDRASLGVLLLNQIKRRTWKPRAKFMFDKILHDRYDKNVGDEFFGSKAIFVFRQPEPTIASIRILFERLGSREYSTDVLAAQYYETRLANMIDLWNRFPSGNRVAVTHDLLTDDTDNQLKNISALIGLKLTNNYVSKSASQRPGAGDPLSSHRFTGIVDKTRASSIASARFLDLTAAQLGKLETAYSTAQLSLIGTD